MDLTNCFEHSPSAPTPPAFDGIEKEDNTYSSNPQVPATAPQDTLHFVTPLTQQLRTKLLLVLMDAHP